MAGIDDRQDALPYYLDELAYLRRMGREFAHLYPKIAARLELADGLSTDPHVERLIESFAFLTARLERRLDLELPEISASLLSALYPNLVNPVPPLAIARIQVDPAQGKITTAHIVPRHTRLFAQAQDGSVCRFRTCYPVELWPLEVVQVDLLPRAAFSVLDRRGDVSSVLRVRLEQRGTKFSEMALDRLRFHLHGESTLTSALYDLLAQATCGVALVCDNAADVRFLPPTALTAAGFEPDDVVIPSAPNSHPAYRLLQEYLHFPAKYHFFDLHHLDRRPTGDVLDILFLFDRSPIGRLPVDRNSILLGCTPIHNLFAKTTEPVRIDQRRVEYRLVGDLRREAITEIHSIRSVTASADPAKPSLEVQPFFSARHAASPANTAFWHARRAPTGRADLPGTDLWLGFVDLSFAPAQPPTQVVYAHTLCTNRELALQLPAGAALQIEESAPIAQINCLTSPTETLHSTLGGAALWKLVSTLSLNHLSLATGRDGLDALREMLRLYNFSNSPFVDRQIEGISLMRARPVAGRIGTEAWRGFCRGTEVTLAFDDGQYVGASTVLFASVLHRFFGLHAAINSFTQLVMLKGGQEHKRWAPLVGAQQIF